MQPMWTPPQPRVRTQAGLLPAMQLQQAAGASPGSPAGRRAGRTSPESPDLLRVQQGPDQTHPAPGYLPGPPPTAGRCARSPYGATAILPVPVRAGLDHLQKSRTGARPPGAGTNNRARRATMRTRTIISRADALRVRNWRFNPI